MQKNKSNVTHLLVSHHFSCLPFIIAYKINISGPEAFKGFVPFEINLCIKNEFAKGRIYYL